MNTSALYLGVWGRAKVLLLAGLLIATFPVSELGVQHGSDVDSRADGVAILHINSSTGNDPNPGSRSSPVRTIQKGVNLANAAINTNHDVMLYVASGVYRESVDFRSVSNSDRSLDLRAEPGTVLSGSDQWATGWMQQLNGIYVHNWPYRWGMKAIPDGWDSYWHSDGKGYIRNRMRRYEALFIDDQPLFNRLELSELSTAGTFYVNEEMSKIYVRPHDADSFDSGTIEVAIRQSVLSVNDR